MGGGGKIKKLRVVVFGCGKMGLHHIRGIGLQRAAELAAVCDLSVSETSLKPLLPSNVLFFRDPEELLREARPDVVHICTPPNTHVSLAKLALEHGAHVYVEKPFALRTVEAEPIISLANEMGVKVCAGHQLLFEDPARKAREFLREIGRIVHIESYFSFRMIRRSTSPADQLIDILPHPVCLLLHFLYAGSCDKGDDRIELRSLDVRSSGDVHGIIRMGDATGHLVVTLCGRPIESYLRIVGTNGCLHADFVRGTVTKSSGPGCSTLAMVINPYSQAKQILVGTTKAFAKRALSRQKSYPGVLELIRAFYASILNGTPPPITPTSILETVSICEAIGKKLKEAEAESNRRAKAKFQCLERELTPPDPQKGLVLVTGGTGFLGRAVTAELRSHGWPVRVLARHLPHYSARIPGVEYATSHLADTALKKLLQGVSTIVHCAAETAGDLQGHERNTVAATRNILISAARAGVGKFIHISSLAVLKTSREVGEPLDENTSIDLGNLSRGPYVWGKAESERLALELGEELGLSVRVIRPGPLVDLTAFEAPGRLGREVGPLFVAIGGRRNKLSLCEVNTAAEVVRAYVDGFDAAPPILNLIEPNAPTRAELVARLLKERPDLKAFWVPPITLKVMSPLLKAFQRFLLPGKKPIDIRDTFSSENYKTDLAETIIKKVHQHSTSIKR